MDEIGLVTAHKIGTANIILTSMGGVSATCQVEVIPDVPVPDAVDMGLTSGVKWASFDLGASEALGDGSYFAWGETQPKKSYDWSTYAFLKSGTISNPKFTKYVTDSQYGTQDNISALERTDDPACVHLGGKWRTPTDMDFYELYTNCDITWEWDESHNYPIKVTFTSKLNGQSIVFAAMGGYMEGTESVHVEDLSCYWSRTLPYPNNDKASGLRLYFEGEMVYRDARFFRCFGLKIRPIQEL